LVTGGAIANSREDKGTDNECGFLSGVIRNVVPHWTCVVMVAAPLATGRF
jgi:hypothetical protein